MEDQNEIEKYSLEFLESDLLQKHKDFCREYFINGWNQVKAYMKVYPDSSYQAAAASANEILKNPKVKQYLNFLKEDLEKTCFVNKASVLIELVNIAKSSIATLHNTWITLHEFDSLTDDQKSAIESIETKTMITNFDDTTRETEYVKLKLFSKQAAIESINKMLGYNLPEKRELTGAGGAALIPIKGITFDSE